MSSVRIDGLQRLQVKLKNLRPEVEEILSGEIEAAAENIERMAKDEAPNIIETSHGDQSMDEYGQIRSALSAWQVNKLEWQTGMPVTGPINDIAGYIEFGTGKFIDIPVGLEKYAMWWFKNGRGTILPHAFLFPAVEQERTKFIERLKADLNAL